MPSMDGYERPVKRAGKTIGFIQRTGPLYVAKDIRGRPLRGSHSRLDALDAVWRCADRMSKPSN